jgi:nicotinamide-nucleotide amidase
VQQAWILSIGTELSLGQTVDTNSAWLAARLARLGIRATHHLTIADDLNAIRDAFQLAAEHSELVIATGGLGPTDDDLTREALALATETTLVMDESSLRDLEAFFERRGRTMPDRNRCQAMRPEVAQHLPNSCGTAPGLTLQFGSAWIYALPGVPFEMRTMYEQSVRGALESQAKGRVIVSRRLQTFGLPESDLGEKIADLMVRGANPEVGTTASFGLIGVRINAEAENQAAAERMLDQTEAAVRERLGEVVYGIGEQSLAEVLSIALRERGQTLALAESCTGGLVAEQLTALPGSSDVFVGGTVTYANAAKEQLLGVPRELLERQGAVSAAVAEAMAIGARRRFGADYALSLTGIAGPGGGSAEKPVGLVFAALADAAGCTVREYQFGSDSPREAIRLRAAHAALNQLRLRLR